MANEETLRAQLASVHMHNSDEDEALINEFLQGADRPQAGETQPLNSAHVEEVLRKTRSYFEGK